MPDNKKREKPQKSYSIRRSYATARTTEKSINQIGHDAFPLFLLHDRNGERCNRSLFGLVLNRHLLQIVRHIRRRVFLLRQLGTSVSISVDCLVDLSRLLSRVAGTAIVVR